MRRYHRKPEKSVSNTGTPFSRTLRSLWIVGVETTRAPGFHRGCELFFFGQREVCPVDVLRGKHDICRNALIPLRVNNHDGLFVGPTCVPPTQGNDTNLSREKGGTSKLIDANFLP